MGLAQVALAPKTRLPVSASPLFRFSLQLPHRQALPPLQALFRASPLLLPRRQYHPSFLKAAAPPMPRGADGIYRSSNEMTSCPSSCLDTRSFPPSGSSLFLGRLTLAHEPLNAAPCG